MNTKTHSSKPLKQNKRNMRLMAEPYLLDATNAMHTLNLIITSGEDHGENIKAGIACANDVLVRALIGLNDALELEVEGLQHSKAFL